MDNGHAGREASQFDGVRARQHFQRANGSTRQAEVGVARRGIGEIGATDQQHALGGTPALDTHALRTVDDARQQRQHVLDGRTGRQRRFQLREVEGTRRSQRDADLNLDVGSDLDGLCRSLECQIDRHVDVRCHAGVDDPLGRDESGERDDEPVATTPGECRLKPAPRIRAQRGDDRGGLAGLGKRLDDDERVWQRHLAAERRHDASQRARGRVTGGVGDGHRRGEDQHQAHAGGR